MAAMINKPMIGVQARRRVGRVFGACSVTGLFAGYRRVYAVLLLGVLAVAGDASIHASAPQTMTTSADIEVAATQSMPAQGAMLEPGHDGVDNTGQHMGEDQPVVILRGLDKITARISEISVPVGEEGRFGSLLIKPQYCRQRSPIETPETFAYLDIYQQRSGQDDSLVFSGWMVASNPALNPLEHSVYDVWVMSCSAVVPSSESPASR